MEKRDEFVVPGGEEREEPAFEGGVVGFGGVEVGADAVAAGKGSGGEERALEDVFLLDFCGVEEDGKTDGVEDGDDVWVAGNEWPWWHIGPKDCGVVFLDSGLEEFVLALVVEVVVPVSYWAEKG